MKEKKFIKICPKCGSTNITIPPSGLDLKMSQPDYCKDCKNRGIFPEIEEDKVEYFKKVLKNKEA
ncbi:MAG: hypothetical protein KKA65_00820 [Nanoarchaeota archaeon]|nr:hypothetical protein [Nanoarchaeota archaeon]MBU4242257.1 hypothetical protein [Nanoarchaeota archaeon]MBU4352264.1 hypothetical protein [Nanoarchaeota archaeon]MBU4456020.1 hypothetical protein [Nanoarchaeota archaeon]MCG2719530.1 hypothetical protein [Nanoarchaeota archaeon]